MGSRCRTIEKRRHSIFGINREKNATTQGRKGNNQAIEDTELHELRQGYGPPLPSSDIDSDALLRLPVPAKPSQE